MTMTVISVRIDKEIEKNLEFLMSKKKSVDKSTMIRLILAKSLNNEIIEVLCSEVKERKISAWKAASMAKVSLRKMLDELALRNIFTYDDITFSEDLDFLRKKYESDN